MRCSDRLAWSRPTNRMACLLAEKHSAGEPLLDLTVSNPTLAPAYPHDAIAAALGSPSDFGYRPDPLGSSHTRETISRYYRELGFEVPAARIALAASTSEAYALLSKLLCNPGDEILVPAPSYPLLEYLAALENVSLVPYRLRYDGSWFPDFDHLRAQISPRARALVLVNPNNPTGSFLKDDERLELIEIAERANLPVISDEVFMEFEFGTHPRRVKTLVEETRIPVFSLNGLSKTAGMPQMKLAWIVWNGPAGEHSLIQERLELVLDTYLSVNTPVQLALPELLAIGAGIRADLRARCFRNLAAAAELLAKMPVHPLHAEGGWSLILQLPAMLDEEEFLYSLLERENVVLQPGFFFDMPSAPFAVASLICAHDDFREGLARLNRHCGHFIRC